LMILVCGWNMKLLKWQRSRTRESVICRGAESIHCHIVMAWAFLWNMSISNLFSESCIDPESESKTIVLSNPLFQMIWDKYLSWMWNCILWFISFRLEEPAMARLCLKYREPMDPMQSHSARYKDGPMTA
jgi:hypothetical protein